MKTYTAQELARITATPAALGKHIGQEFMGRPYKVYPWVLHMEQQILSMLYRPGNEILIISVPPQQGKSTYCSFLVPLWYLARNPSHQVINISYNEKQAGKWGLRVLAAMKMYGREMFGITVNPDSDSALDWKLGNGFGGMMSAGLQGGISGNPGDLIICDDTLKNAVEANSPLIKRRNLADWDDSVTTRFQGDTKVLVVATRWAEDDLSGELIARSQVEGYDGFHVSVMNIKALAEPDPEDLLRMSEDELANWTDFLGRKYGEGLKGQHSQRFFEVKRASTPIGRWMSLHQGTPTAAFGGMFPESNWKYWWDSGERVLGDADLPHMVQKVRIWDIASSEGAGDWTVGTLLGRDSEGRVFILGRERFRHAPGLVEAKIKAAAEADGHETTVLIEEERSGAGKTVVAHYQRELPAYRVEAAKAEGDKESRATPYSIMQNNGKIFLPRNASWTREWVQEHSQMDGKGGRPKHDDQIDTGAHGVRWIIGSSTSSLWHAGMFEIGDDVSPEDRLELEAIRYAIGR